jgi:hypothetical protein
MSQPVLSPLGPDSPCWRVVDDFRQSVPHTGCTVVVTRGFREFDGTSVPRALWSVWGHPFSSRFLRTALVHDFLYKTPAARICNGKPLDRRQIDGFMYRLLRMDGVSLAVASAMYLAVRVFGGDGYVVSATVAELEALSAELSAERARLVGLLPVAVNAALYDRFLPGEPVPKTDPPRLDLAEDVLAAVDWDSVRWLDARPEPAD